MHCKAVRSLATYNCIPEHVDAQKVRGILLGYNMHIANHHYHFHAADTFHLENPKFAFQDQKIHLVIFKDFQGLENFWLKNLAF